MQYPICRQQKARLLDLDENIFLLHLPGESICTSSLRRFYLISSNGMNEAPARCAKRAKRILHIVQIYAIVLKINHVLQQKLYPYRCR